MEELKEKAEQQLRAQRAAHQLKTAAATGAVTPGTAGVVRLAVAGGKVNLPGTRTTATLVSASGTNTTGTPTLARRIVISQDGKKTVQLIKTTTGAAAGAAGGTLQLIAPSPGTGLGTGVALPAGAVSQSGGKQLQIIKGPDGKVQIRGLTAGQHLVRLADGRLTIVNSTAALQTGAVVVGSSTAATGDATGTAASATPKTVVVKTIASPAGTGQKPVVGQQIVLAGNSSTALAQQLASGKLQLGIVNGQQVLIQTGSGGVPVTQPTLAVAAAATKPGEATPATPTAASAAAATPTTATVAAQTPVAAATKQQTIVLQTPQGQRIVVQNLHGGTLTPQQLAAIQEQLKAQNALRGQAGNNAKPGIERFCKLLAVKLSLPPDVKFMQYFILQFFQLKS